MSLSKVPQKIPVISNLQTIIKTEIYLTGMNSGEHFIEKNSIHFPVSVNSIVIRSSNISNFKKNISYFSFLNWIYKLNGKSQIIIFEIQVI